MNFTKKRFLIIIGLFLVVFSFSLTYSDYVIDNKLNEAYELSQITGKPLVILFSIKNCHDCVELKEKTLSETKTIEFLKEKFIVVDINPVPFYFGRFPLNDEKAEEISYSILFREFSVKRTPTMMFFDLQGNYVNRLQGFYDSDFLLKTILTLSPIFNNKQEQLVKLITDKEQAKLFLETLPNAKSFTFEQFKNQHQDLDPLDYFIVEQSNFEEVHDFLLVTKSPVMNVLVYEEILGEYEETTKEKDKEEEDLTEGFWTDVNKSQLEELLEEDSDLIILDVRTPEEYEAGHINGAVNINVLADDFEQILKDYDTEDVYLVYCKSGGRSLMAVKKMNELGFEFIYHYPGGYSDFVK